MVFTISVFILDLLPALQNFAKVQPPAVMILIGSPDINQHYFNHDLFYVVYCCVLLSHQIPLEYANNGWLIVVWCAFAKDQGRGVPIIMCTLPHNIVIYMAYTPHSN